MTTFKYTIQINDSQAIALRAALDLLKEECNLHIANKQAVPWKAYLHSIASMQAKLANGAQQTSGNTFFPSPAVESAKVEQALRAVVAPMALHDEEQEQYFERLMAMHSKPSPAIENAFFAEQRATGTGVGMDDAGNLIYGHAVGAVVVEPAKVDQALRGLVAPMALTDEGQEQYFERFGASHWEPSATENAHFAERRAAGKGVGMDDAGALVYQYEGSAEMANDRKLLETVTRDMRATERTQAPHPDDAKHWSECIDTQTGQRTWRRLELVAEWSRLQTKIRQIK